MKKIRNLLFTLAVLMLCLFLLPTEAEAAQISYELSFALSSDQEGYYVSECDE